MRFLVILTVGVCLLLASMPVIADQAADELAIKKAAAQMATAYSNQDAAGVAACYHEDGEMVRTDSSVLVGRTAIRQVYQEIFEISPEIGTKASVDSIRFLKPDVAIILVRGTVTGRTVEPPTWKYLRTSVVVKSGGDWKVALSQFLEDTTE